MKVTYSTVEIVKEFLHENDYLQRDLRMLVTVEMKETTVQEYIYEYMYKDEGTWHYENHGHASEWQDGDLELYEAIMDLEGVNASEICKEAYNHMKRTGQKHERP